MSGGDHVIAAVLLLDDGPHRLDVVPPVPPVAQRTEISQPDVRLLPERDLRDRAGDLARDERLAAPRRLVVEQDPVARVHRIRLPVIHSDPVRIELRNGIR
jgi:hypothetical protein